MVTALSTTFALCHIYQAAADRKRLEAFALRCGLEKNGVSGKHKVTNADILQRVNKKI